MKRIIALALTALLTAPIAANADQLSKLDFGDEPIANLINDRTSVSSTPTDSVTALAATLDAEAVFGKARTELAEAKTAVEALAPQVEALKATITAAEKLGDLVDADALAQKRNELTELADQLETIEATLADAKLAYTKTEIKLAEADKRYNNFLDVETANAVEAQRAAKHAEIIAKLAAVKEAKRVVALEAALATAQAEMADNCARNPNLDSCSQPAHLAAIDAFSDGVPAVKVAAE